MQQRFIKTRLIFFSNNQDIKIICMAFSGLVVDGETEYTETKMNVTKSGENVRENQLKEAFHTDLLPRHCSIES
jgi:hypothetical protein